MPFDEFPTASLFYYLHMRADGQACRPSLPDDQVDLAVETFRMLADGTRVRILWALIGRELSVNELAAEVGKPPTSVSQHLAKLRMSRMVSTRREGAQVFYRLENEHVGQLVTDAIHNAEHSGPGVPGHHLADRDLVQLHRGTEGA
jgi:DNA-binding transcriptional ArsR family regulator